MFIKVKNEKVYNTQIIITKDINYIFDCYIYYIKYQLTGLWFKLIEQYIK
jgi:hypothetical protein